MKMLTIRIDSPPHGCHKSNVLTNFHEDWTINVTNVNKKMPCPWQPYIIGKNLLTKFHEDLKKKCPTSSLTCFSNIIDQFDDNQKINDFNDDWMIMWPLEKTDLPSGGHVFQEILTKFHED
ncbi:hypothetical protein DPMN_009730 [Dreissena polymorpha]|uniref:Uncharacterized protein n=1 Tax=Dreissena polymorpha TaxID=45954 RepID=A0A9D4RYG8_DREPO|nr:hypothetical protein DPMN_009730 [Dreissena polymorpha]